MLCTINVVFSFSIYTKLAPRQTTIYCKREWIRDVGCLLKTCLSGREDFSGMSGDYWGSVYRLVDMINPKFPTTKNQDSFFNKIEIDSSAFAMYPVDQMCRSSEF